MSLGGVLEFGKSRLPLDLLQVIVLFALLLPMSMASAQATVGTDTEQADPVTAAAVAAASAVAANAKNPSTTSPDRHSSGQSNTLSMLATCLRSYPSGMWVFVVALILVLCATTTLLVRATTLVQGAVSISTLTTSFFFWLGIGYLLFLLLIGIFYAFQRGSGPPYMLGGLLPLAVPWFGALGAVTISLAGVFFYSDQGWDKKYNYWHIGRPLFGAVLGVVAYFIFILIVSSAGSPIAIFSASPPKSKDCIIYYVLAFLVGYREETFRELIQRATDLILKPSAPPAVASLPSVSFKLAGSVLAVANFGHQAAGSATKWTIDIENDGKAALTSPAIALENGSATQFTASGNQLSGAAELKPGDVKSVDITFSPTAGPNSFTGTLIVTGSNLNKAARLPLTGSA